MHGNMAKRELVSALTLSILALPTAAHPAASLKTSKEGKPRTDAFGLEASVFRIEKLTKIAAVPCNKNPSPKPN